LPGDRAGSRRLDSGHIPLLFALVVEVFQLTLIPRRFSQSNSFFLRFASILLGTQFAWLDIVAYLVGIAGCTCLTSTG
jgi:hypothetical protein